MYEGVLMEENVQQNEEGLSLIYIIRLLFSKIKWLILACLIGGFLGGVFGVIRTYDMKYYGTSIEFYVNPEKAVSATAVTNTNNTSTVGSQYGVYGSYGNNVMDTMIKLLEAENFTERLMLEDNGLPSLELYPDLSQEKYLTSEQAIQAANAEWAKVAEWETAKTEKLEEVNNQWEIAGFDLAWGTFNETTYRNLLKTAPSSIPAELQTAYSEFVDVQKHYLEAVEVASSVQKQSDTVVEEFLNEWRALPKYNSTLKKFNSSIKYSYLDEDVELSDATYLARSFITVDLNVLNDEEFANDLLVRVKRSVPAYIEEKMFVPDGYTGTTCTRITRNDDIHRTNPNYRAKQSIKYAILAAMATGVIAAAFIIVLDTQDKRLRDYEVITKTLNVPVLGIIPTIEELKRLSDEKEQHNKEVK